MTRAHRALLSLARILVLLTLVSAWALIIDERCSKQLDGNDILWEEVK